MPEITKQDAEIQAKVAALYDRFPYPNYPLLGKPRWQDGYLTSSWFAGRLVASRLVAPAGDTLVAGCGEILPYIIRKWEAPGNAVANVDLSRRSLRRGRLRTLLCRGASEFHHKDIVEFLASCAREGRQFAHIETFGMLHHMADPGPAIAAMAQQLLPGGTIRAMVYNSPGRWWIHRIQDEFRNSGIDILGGDPVAATREAKSRILAMAATSPELAAKVKAIGKVTLDNPARVADMFLHPHELRWPVERWFEVFAGAGLQLAGIFDRYGELDDLPNPLLDPASVIRELPRRANAQQFEGNLEMFWFKPVSDARHSPQGRDALHLRRLKLRLPPLQWFDFEETRDLGIHNRLQIWHAFLDGKKLTPSAWGKSVATLKRLARLGAILPEQVDQNLRSDFYAPF
ncbi:MAG: hypothetical protein RIQ81_502 [Pseudomonadota bacterium]